MDSKRLGDAVAISGIGHGGSDSGEGEGEAGEAVQGGEKPGTAILCPTDAQLQASIAAMGLELKRRDAAFTRSHSSGAQSNRATIARSHFRPPPLPQNLKALH